MWDVLDDGEWCTFGQEDRGHANVSFPLAPDCYRRQDHHTIMHHASHSRPAPAFLRQFSSCEWMCDERQSTTLIETAANGWLRHRTWIIFYFFIFEFAVFACMLCIIHHYFCSIFLSIPRTWENPWQVLLKEYWNRLFASSFFCLRAFRICSIVALLWYRFLSHKIWYSFVLIGPLQWSSIFHRFFHSWIFSLTSFLLPCWCRINMNFIVIHPSINHFEFLKQVNDPCNYLHTFHIIFFLSLSLCIFFFINIFIHNLAYMYINVV